MKKMAQSIGNIIHSEIVKEQAAELVENAVGVFMKDPLAAKNAAAQLYRLSSTIRDGIYWENFMKYLLHIYEFDENGNIKNEYKRKISEMLAEYSPNEESGYEGDSYRLRENAKRLVKLIDDAGTIQKSVYYANLTRAALNEQISRAKFFKLCNCIRNLTEEDLHFLIIDIQKVRETTIREDRNFIDDFRAVGLLKEVDGGFGYTLRAFELMKYGLMYEQHIDIPDDIQQRMMSASTNFKMNGETLVIERGNA